MKTILITGIAVFMGYSLAKQVDLNRFNIVGLDNLNSYYDVNLKIDRINDLVFLDNFEDNIFYKRSRFPHMKLYTISRKSRRN